MAGGEGSRGGRVIGHTRGGAPIYASQLSRAGLAAHRDTAPAARPPHPQGPIKHQSEVERVRSLSHADYQREHAADLIAVAARQKAGNDPRHVAYMGPKMPKPRLYQRTNNLMAAARQHPLTVSPEVQAVQRAQQAGKLRPRGNLDRPAVMNKPGYKPR